MASHYAKYEQNPSKDKGGVVYTRFAMDGSMVKANAVYPLSLSSGGIKFNQSWPCMKYNSG